MTLQPEARTFESGIVQPQMRPLAVVTGGSGGIGFELARQFAQNGFDLVLAAEDFGRLAEAAHALTGLGEGGLSQVETLAVDLATFDGTQQLYDFVVSLGRPVDALAVTASAGGAFTGEAEMSDELRLIDLNIKHVVHLVTLVSGDMAQRGSGRILITSSAAGGQPGSGGAVDVATRAFLESFSLAVRRELQDTGVTVTTLQAGPAVASLLDAGGLSDPITGRHALTPDLAGMAREGFEALMAGKEHVVAGAMNTIHAGLALLLPDVGKAALHGPLPKPAGH